MHRRKLRVRRRALNLRSLRFLLWIFEFISPTGADLFSCVTSISRLHFPAPWFGGRRCESGAIGRRFLADGPWIAEPNAGANRAELSGWPWSQGFSSSVFRSLSLAFGDFATFDVMERFFFPAEDAEGRRFFFCVFCVVCGQKSDVQWRMRTSLLAGEKVGLGFLEI